MRKVTFYGVLVLPMFAWAIIVLPNYFIPDMAELSATIVAAAVAISPIIGGDISVFGEVTPVVLAGSVIALMPQSKQINYLAIVLAIISYALFLHLSFFFSSGRGVGLLSEKFPSIGDSQKVILNLVSNVGGHDDCSFRGNLGIQSERPRLRGEDHMFRSIVSLLAALVLNIPEAYCDQTRLVAITVENKTPNFSAVPQIEVFGAPPKTFTALAPTIYQYKFPVSDNDWFNTVDVKVLWKNAFASGDGTPEDFEQRILLRIRRDFPDEFSFPIYFSNNRSQAEMSRLEHEEDINQQFEVFFRGGQIAAYYRDILGAQHPFTVREPKYSFMAR